MASGDYREWRRLARSDPSERRRVFQHHYDNGEFGMVGENDAWLNFEVRLHNNPQGNEYLFTSYFADNNTDIRDYLRANRGAQRRANRGNFRMSGQLRNALVATAIGLGSLGMAYAIDGQDNHIVNGVDELLTYVGAGGSIFGGSASIIFGLRDWFRR